jgi:ABC-type Zn uptake system ZnuABC Zn-binding protein ZnuA
MNKEFLFSTLPFVFAVGAVFLAVAKVRGERTDSDNPTIVAAIFAFASFATAILGAFNL